MDDLLAAAVQLQAGALGAALKEAGFEVTTGPPEEGATTLQRVPQASSSPAAETIGVEGAARALLQQATLCAFHCGHAMIGTPHVLVAGLRFYEPLRAFVRKQSVDPDQLVAEIARALGCARDDDPFAEVPHCPTLPWSPNLYSAIQGEARPEQGFRPAAFSPLDLIAAVLNHPTRQAVLVLQACGLEPSLIVRDLRQSEA